MNTAFEKLMRPKVLFTPVEPPKPKRQPSLATTVAEGSWIAFAVLRVFLITLLDRLLRFLLSSKVPLRAAELEDPKALGAARRPANTRLDARRAVKLSSTRVER